LERHNLDINTVVEHALEVTAYSLRSSNIEVVVDLRENLPSVFADPNQLGQVITNLVVNAQHALVGENRDHINTIQEYLELNGCRVMQGENASKARELNAAELEFDLVLLDITMPGEDGLSLYLQ